MNKGFFTPEDTIISRGDEKLKAIKPPTEYNCAKCGLLHMCNSPKMSMSGEGKLKILIVGEAPGKTEDEQGTQFVGSSGQLLRKIIKELGYDLDKDFYKTNAVRCPSKTSPTNIQINACRKYLMKDIEQANPKVIIALGKTAVEGLIGHRLQGRISGCSMTDWANVTIPDQELKRWVCPTWHPSYLLRSSPYGDVINEVLYRQVKDAINKAIELAEQPFYVSNYFSECMSITTVEEAIQVIEIMMTKKQVAFDYETTGRKPHREGHKIYTVSISDGLFSYAFPYFNDKKFRRRWMAFLASDVGKIAHNIKFENLWSVVRSNYNDAEGVEINNAIWDTMLGGHSLYNNKRTSLKFYSYIHFGMLGYDAEMDPYLEATPIEESKYGTNGFNRIEEAPLDKLLAYNAMDSLLTYKLWELQNNILEPHLIKGAKFFTKGAMALSKVENNGICFDEVEAKKIEKELQNKLDTTEKKVLTSKELKQWDRNKQFRISAPADITHLLFDILGYEVQDTTNTGKPKSDIKALSKYKILIVKDCLEWRKWQKVYNTYIKDLFREEHEGKIHAFYNLNTVDSMRSSCSSPNVQNQPKHDKETFNLIRKLYRPSKGNKLVEYDYGQLEVIILSSYNKDPNLLAYINDSNTDMHRDMASIIFLKEPEDISSDERYVAKNSFVFPTFYGSYYKNTAVELWNNCSKETRKYLKEQGFRSIDDFTVHIQEIEKQFWEEKFPIGYEWMNSTIKEFNKKGYMDSYTGFRYWGPLSNNQIINFRIQGSGFHCLLWTLIKVQDEIEKRGMNSKIIGEIHDSMIGDIVPEEEQEIDRMVWNYGTQKIREHWKWIISPLVFEKSISEIDGNWASMQSCGNLTGG